VKITQRKPSDLIAYANNAKKHPDEQIDLLANSIRDYGFTAPIVVDKDGVLMPSNTTADPSFYSKKREAGRKLGKTHQNVLIFVKGDSKKATLACGKVEFGEIEPDVVSI
jgi:hypothetical protein